MGESLSKASPYEQAFGTRHRKVGRPQGDTEPLFGTRLAGREVDPTIALIASVRIGPAATRLDRTPTLPASRATKRLTDSSALLATVIQL